MEQITRKIKNIIFIFLIINSTIIGKNLKQELKNMELSQKYILAKSYITGEPENLGLTLVAIAWQESKGGKFLMNLSDPSFGVFHIKVRGNHWQRSREAERLMNFDYSAKEAIKVLQWWKTYHKGNWQLMIKSYNSGFSYNSKQAENYLKAIQAKVKIIQAITKDIK